MYISRNSIVIKTNYETRRRDRDVARRRAGARAKKLGKHPLRSSWQTTSCPIADRQTDRQTIFDSRPDLPVLLTRIPTSRLVAKIQRCLLATIRPTYELSTLNQLLLLLESLTPVTIIVAMFSESYVRYVAMDRRRLARGG